MTGCVSAGGRSLEAVGLFSKNGFNLRISREAGINAPLDPEGVARVAAAVFETPGVISGGERWDFSIVFCGNGFIRSLNRDFRGIDEPTDILSFEIGDAYEDEVGRVFFNAGEIIISIERLFFNASEFNVGLNEELKRLIIHGILHLSGRDHKDNSPEQEMLRLQEGILNSVKDEIVFEEEQNGIS